MVTARHILVAGSLFLLVACGNTVTDSEYVDQAQDYLDKGQLNMAAIELKNALQQNPNNPQARRLLGVVHFSIGDMAGAEKELKRARELGVAEESLSPLLARALLIQGKYQDLDALPIKGLASETAKAEVLAAKGQGKLAGGNVVEAQQLIDEAIAQAPDSTYAGVAKAQLLAAKKEYEGARKELDRVLRLDPKYPPAWSLLGTLQKSLEQYVEAESSYTKAIDYQKANVQDLLNRAFVRIQLKKYEAAQKDIDKLVKRLPKNSGVLNAQGLIHLHGDSLQAAKDDFERSLQVDDRQVLPKYYLALINLRLGNIEQADQYGEQTLAAAPGAILVREVLATIKLKQREFSKVEELVLPILSSHKSDVRAINLLASALMGQKKDEQAVPLLKKVIDLQPESAMAEFRLGVALLASGKSDEGVEHIERSLNIDPKFNLGYLLLVRHYMDQEDPAKAMQVADIFREHQPDSTIPLNLIGSLLIKKGDEKSAVNTFERALKLAPGDPGASHRLASLAIKAKDYQKARDYYLGVLETHKDHLDTLLKLAQLDAIENDEPAMIARLKQALSTHPNSVRAAVMLARYYLVKGEPDKVAPLMVGLSSQNKSDPGVLEVMAYSQLDQKQYSDAKYNLEQLVQRRPKVAQLHFVLGKVFGGLGDSQSMERELLETVKLDPEHFAARMALARLAMSQNNKDMMERQISELEKLAPKNADVLYLKGALARVEGSQETATHLFEEAFDKAPDTRTMLSLARQKWVTGDRQSALEVQEEWLKDHPDDLVASLALAGAYVNQPGDENKAITEYEKVLNKDRENVAALNDLAWNLRDKEPERALEYAKKASELEPNSGAVLDTLAMVQLSNKQLDLAERTIIRALERSPNNPSIQYHSALIAFTSGDRSLAETRLKSLVSKKLDFPESKDAEELLRKIRAE